MSTIFDIYYFYIIFMAKCINLYLQQDSNKQKCNDISTQDSLLHSSLERSKDEATCFNDICGTCELQEIKLSLKLRSFAIYVFFCIILRYYKIKL